MNAHPVLVITGILKNRIVRFFLVSGLNTAFGYGLFAFLIFIGLHYTVAGLVGTIIAILFNFKSTGLLVFGTNRNGIIFKFFGVYGINYLLSIALLTVLERSGIDAFLGRELFHLTNLLILTAPRANTCIGGAILIVPMGLFAYALNHRFVFSAPEAVTSQKIK
jgi:putative flippase GtrA